MTAGVSRSEPNNSNRREFVKGLAAALGAAALPRRRAPARAEAPAGSQSGTVVQISDHVLVYRGPVNVGIVRDGHRALLIDCGDGRVAEALPRIGVSAVSQLLFTHHHRDQCCGAGRFVAAGARVAVPAAEAKLFAEPQSYWNDDRHIFRVYRTFRPDHLTLTEPIGVDRELKEGDELRFGPARIRVLATPGHTEGSVSYVVDADGRSVVFCGDCIYGHGKVWDIYSLQKGFSKGGRTIGGYHGFMGDRWRLVDGLRRIKRLQPDALVPSHGEIMHAPAAAIDLLADRFERCYENYVSISALRHYFPELFRDYEGRPGQMPIRPGFKPPDCLRHFGTTWMLVSRSGAALVMDVGSPAIVKRIKQMLDAGEIKSVEGLWVTHYHFDHTAGIRAFQKQFDCPCYMERRLADVLTRPHAWRLPCLEPNPIRVDRPLEDGHAWQWREFKLTAYFYPGQTLYHDALLVEHGELRMLFIGDSHTMAGIDDYCTYNRNWLGPGVGFQYCLDLIERLKPTHMFNCHVKDAFNFTADEIKFMRRKLTERERLFGELLAWDHPNYGTDPSWVRCDPYMQAGSAGRPVELDVVVTNHSSVAQAASCRAVPPKRLGSRPTDWAKATVPAKKEARLKLVVPVPPEARPGRYVIAIDVNYADRVLPQFSECILDVS